MGNRKSRSGVLFIEECFDLVVMSGFGGRRDKKIGEEEKGSTVGVGSDFVGQQRAVTLDSSLNWQL